VSKPSAYELSPVQLDGVVLAPPVGRPTNYTRSLFHVASGVFTLGLLRLLPGRAWLIAVASVFFAAAWTMEAARRRSPEVNERLMRFFGPVAHPHERHRVNSSTWYVTALILLSLVGAVAGALAELSSTRLDDNFTIPLAAAAAAAGAQIFLPAI
jgi:dolichol kinase